ncbi:unnamed protein product [Rotaria magnacalcarata]|uniref:DNA topoisomerase (ATP-hydrolyzing) n=1 Tax=Rotaria magnacalcarata TaxID=392030 RepID=A0A820NV06_9BILA|nr:unnamed protein product [Rotaria magnacalcarata]
MLIKRREQNLSADYLYKKDTKLIHFNDFINKELVLYSKTSTEHAISSIMDGLKPGLCKIMFICFTKNFIRDIKVARLAGKVAENSAYHHGEQPLINTIVDLAQNFVSLNNINFLVPAGQFCTCLYMVKFICFFVCLIYFVYSPLVLSLFNNDELLLTYLNEDEELNLCYKSFTDENKFLDNDCSNNVIDVVYVKLDKIFINITDLPFDT